MIGRAIYFIDGWVRMNIHSSAVGEFAEPEQLAKQCIDDAAKEGISGVELEQDLGTDLIDFLSHELASRRTKVDADQPREPTMATVLFTERR
jgi:hypothetical protein